MSWNNSGDTWGSNPATTTNAANDEWNSAPAGADGWNEGGATGLNDNDEGNTQFADGIRAPAGDLGGSGDQPIDDYRPNAQGGCFNCGEDGHIRAECPNPAKPREFTGECNICSIAGHRAKDCPQKPKVCKQCNMENSDHDTIDCKNKRVIDFAGVPEMSDQEAWTAMKEASDDVDVGDAKDLLRVLTKNNPNLTYLDIEKQFRKRNLRFHLIGLKKEVAKGYTNVGPDGSVGKTYTLGIFKSSSCPRPILMPNWPENVANNLERLGDTGIPLDRGIPICSNCNELGHIRKNCTQEESMIERVKIHCVLCDEDGHRARDCTQERPQQRGPRLCKHCESPDHIARDCPDKPAQKPMECRNCFEEGHRASECTNERVLKCNNCDAIGHISKECTAPKDWSRVTCRHCGATGHGSESRCNPETRAQFQAAQAAEAAANGDANGNGFEDAGTPAGNDDWNTASNGTGASGQGNWESAPAPIAVSGGGW